MSGVCRVRDLLKEIVERMAELDSVKDELKDKYFTLWTVLTEWLEDARTVGIGGELVTVDAVLSDLNSICGCVDNE